MRVFLLLFFKTFLLGFVLQIGCANDKSMKEEEQDFDRSYSTDSNAAPSVDTETDNGQSVVDTQTTTSDDNSKGTEPLDSYSDSDDTDYYSDADTDTDTDTDSDTDADTDSDVDADTDTDADADENSDSISDVDSNLDSDEALDSDAWEDFDIVRRMCSSNCMDFPERAIFEDNLQPKDVAIFGEADNYVFPGPCVVEPQLSNHSTPGTLFPADWLRPRFRFVPPNNHDLFEIRIQAEREKHDLLVYTKKTVWTMPSEIWNGLRQTVIDEPINVTIRSVNSVTPDVPAGTTGTFQIAPVKVGGALVYWSVISANVSPEAGKLRTFKAGQELVSNALTVGQAGYRGIMSSDGWKERPASYGVGDGCVQCIGCHSMTPDGEAVAFTDHWPWNIVLTSVNTERNRATPGSKPSFLSEGADALLNQPWLGMPAMSKAYFNDDLKLLITSYGERQSKGGGPVGYSNTPPERYGLAWFDLAADVSLYVSPDYLGDVGEERSRLVSEAFNKGFGFLSLTGEALSAVSPVWSNDGTRIVYTAASKTKDGRIGGGSGQTDVDLHTVPFNSGKGGTVSRVEGACEKEDAEYYPSFSADDRLIAFNKEENFRQTKTVTADIFYPDNSVVIDGSIAEVYYRPHAEVFIIPSTGGKPIRLAANDPPQCTGETSPGVINSRPKWSPDVKKNSTEFGNPRQFYWLVFSSARSYSGQFIVPPNLYSPKDTRASQIYIAAVVRDEKTGEYINYPAIYVWNQDVNSSNLNPSWHSVSTK